MRRSLGTTSIGSGPCCARWAPVTIRPGCSAGRPTAACRPTRHRRARWRAPECTPRRTIELLGKPYRPNRDVSLHGSANVRPHCTCRYYARTPLGGTPLSQGGRARMTVRVGINGFGRIGRQSLKALIERAPDVEVVAVNDLVDTAMNALLFKHDSTYGAYPDPSITRDSLIIDLLVIQVLKERDPAALPWGALGVDIVLESTGIFTDARRRPAPPSSAVGVHRQRPRPRTRTSRSSSASTRTATTRRPTTSSATPAAPRTASRRRPRSSTTAGPSSAG